MVGVTSEPHGSALAPMKGTTYKVAGKTGTAQVIGIAQDKNTARRTSTNGCATTACSWRTRRPRRRGSRSPWSSRTAAAAARAAAPVARKIFDAYFAAEGYVAHEP